MSTKSKLAWIAVIIALLVGAYLFWPLGLDSPPNGSKRLVPTSQQVAPRVGPAANLRVAAPKVPPLAPAAAVNATPAPGGNAASKTWTLNTFLLNSEWNDVGADSPENALQTTFWSRKTGNLEREVDLMFNGHPVNVPNSELSASRAAIYGKVLRAGVVGYKTVSGDVVEMTVREEYENSDVVQEVFQFHRVDDQWKYVLNP